MVDQHVLMCGDTAGMIHPMCGNGMGMAIHAAKMASTLTHQYLSGQIVTRTDLENQYTNVWNKEFRNRLKTGRRLARLFRMEHFSDIMMTGLKLAPGVLPMIIKQTHGEPLEPETFS